MFSTTTTSSTQGYLPLVARILMSSLFIWEGVHQLRAPAATATYIASLNIPMPKVAVWV